MAIIGITIDKKNPNFQKEDFVFWMPQFDKFFFEIVEEEKVETDLGKTYWNKLYPLANNKIFYSIFGTDWELAMSYCLAHYITLISQQNQAPSGSTLNSIYGGGVARGVLTSAQIGSFQKTYEHELTMLKSAEALFWNQTSYGTSLMALLKTKAVPSILVVTSGNIPGANN